MSVNLYHLTLILLISILPVISSSSSSTGRCDPSFSFFGTAIAISSNLTHCRKLPALSAELGWNLFASGVDHFIIDIVFSAQPVSAVGWAAWGINSGPKAQMIGTRALVWIGGPDAGIRTYNITANAKQGCDLTNSSVEFRVENVQWHYMLSSGGRVVMAARLRLPTADYNELRLNHVWQVGQVAAGTVLLPHPLLLENFDSTETLNLATGGGDGHKRVNLRYAHGVLSIIGWGILLPTGIIVGRYFKCFPFKLKKWFRVHSCVQISAYAAGITGWSIGFALLGSSKYYYTIMSHRIIGILIFWLASLQMMALWLTPKKKDKYRKYWSLYHHFVGYSLMALAIVNIFKGFNILRPPHKWRLLYIGILSSIASAVLLLEIITWLKFFYQQYQLKKDIPTNLQ